MREIRTFGSAGVPRPKRCSLKQPSLEAAVLPTHPHNTVFLDARHLANP